jgi:hypothetical protein
VPGWNVRRGQAVWRSTHSSVQLAGELVYASNPDGQILIEFTKTPLPLVVVRITSVAWQLEFIADDHRFTGPGQPPPRSAWLVLPQCLNNHTAPPGWIFNIDADNNWFLGNPRTGEQLDGYLLP